ncbi:hypothetical protein LARI1_G005191 [Lachnellula arida]|uniref:5-Methylcytosine G/T mismatch-specific DNA glycosylase n=1 Tax=Lachnellula arida TaxID=1316785 RepID=A0A8T9BFB9_9HELO|nr:hypothetical protein LARI1_G005191 [Lachnellula arida]
MGTKERDDDVEERPSERRHRSKSEKDPNRKHRPKKIDPITGEPVKSSHRSRKDKEKDKDKDKDKVSQKDRDSEKRSMADVVPELARTASAPGATSRGSLPYPSFNKAHSKEAVNSREDFKLPTKAKPNPYTPDSTDLSSEEKLRSKSAEHFRPSQGSNTQKDGRPPSPPETEFSRQSSQRKAPPSRMSKVQEEVETESRPGSRASWFSRSSKTERDDKSKVSVKSKASTAIKTPAYTTDKAFADEMQREEDDSSSTESNATSVAPKKNPPKVSGQRPPAHHNFHPPDIKPTPSPFIHFEQPEAASSAWDSPQPPPPPPPPDVPINIPQVDYLLQNGGLLRPVPKTLLSATPPFNTMHNGSRVATPVPSEIEKIFGPYYNVLDQYETVVNKNGSLAVATGYRSVARRLLDRLENVFNRDLSSEGCFCVMCQTSDFREHEGSRGLGWGEVLEWVSGRRELPIWPAFDFATLGVKSGDDMAGLGISGHQRNGSDGQRPRSPVNVDPDVADEHIETFLAYAKKSKKTVDKWLSSCPQTAAAPPQEVDDETLSFAILTHLDNHDRPIFNALVTGSSSLQPVSRAPTPLRKPRSDFMVRTVQSLQRLYKLPVPPRDPEAAIYLLKNPHLHNLLATMSSINVSEWEILTSGRFDGFLWSGAEPDSTNPSPAPSRGPTPANGPMRQASNSRTNTPFSPLRNQTFSPSVASTGYPSRGPTPASQFRHPVSNDEETEIAVLAEIEREIYQGMEALEDAFEGLHRKAELVRRALRERGAGLSMSLQSRRTSHPDIISASTPGLGPGYERPSWQDGGSELMSEGDWEPDEELMSEIAPDDSASNISSSRHRRPKRRNERRTPALVEEEDED